MIVSLKVSSRRSDHRARRGFSLVEIIAALFLLATGMTLTVEMVAWSARERRSADRRQTAYREAANALERLAADPSAEIRFSDHAESVLPEASLEIEMTPDSDQPRLSRVSVVIRYQDRGNPAAPVRLTTWLARPSVPRTDAGGEP